MPRKRTYKRRKYRRFKGNKSLQAQINWLKKQNKVNRPELTFHDTSGTSVNIYSTPTIVKIGPTSGIHRITIKSVQLKGQLELDSPTSTVEYYRIIVFSDKVNEGGALPAWGDIYKGASGNAAVNSLREIDRQQNEGQRFKILYDRKFNLIKDTVTHADVRDQVFFDFYKKLNLSSIQGSAGTWWEKGGLYLAFVGTSATGIADFTYDIRTRYIEKTSN